MSLKEMLSPTKPQENQEEITIMQGKLVKQYINREQTKTIKILVKVIGVLGICLFILSYWLVQEANKSYMIPYFVKEDSNGKVNAIGFAKRSNEPVTDSMKQYMIERFIEDFRAVPRDPVLAQRRWRRAANTLTPSAKTIFTREFDKEKWDTKVGLETRQIRIISNVAETTSTYRVNWQEEVFDNGGKLIDQFTMIGSFTIEQIAVRDQEVARDNPMGLYISHFSWQKELRR